jgi:hypothetical protein
MTIQDTGSIGEMIGAVATVATLVYLARQIRTNTSVVRSAAAQSVHENFAVWYRMLATEAELSQIITSRLRDYAALSKGDKARFISTFMVFVSCCQDAHLKFREGSLSQELWSGWEQVMMNLVHSPGGRDFWSERAYLFGEAFRVHVEEDIMNREPHPSAMPMGAFSITRTSMPESSA